MTKWSTTGRTRDRRRIPKPPKPRKPDYFTVHGVDYHVNWRRLQPGYSFFLKTPATAQQVLKSIRPSIAHLHLKYTLVAHNRCEFGYYGVRVWRLS